MNKSLIGESSHSFDAKLKAIYDFCRIKILQDRENV